MNIITTTLLLICSAHLFAQPSCAELWDMSKISTGSDEKFEYLDRYIKLDCKDSLAACFLARGMLFNEFRDTLQANEDFKKAVEIKPTLSEA